MKRSLFIAILGLISAQSNGQAAFPAKEYVDINNIKAATLVHGDLFWDPALSQADCHFPATAPTNINFASALWMSGYDAGGQLHTAAQTYRQTGNDYWPGPLDASDTVTYATSTDWAKIWKVNRADIETFLALSTHTTTNTPAVILNWPAKGNANAKGNAGATLTITNDMAPFVDLNHNGIYEPLLGEYPDVPGDQALWWVFSDNGATHTETNGKPLGVEVHALAYAYKRGTVIDNVIYYDFKVINKSPNNYTNFRMGLWDDVDLGYFQDDYIGFDSVHRMGIAYNGATDDGASGGYPTNSFGTNVPIVGISMVILPGDNLSTHTRVPAGSFMYYNNDASAYGNPAADTEYNHYLRSSFRNGTHLTNDFTGAGTATTGHGTGPNTNYVFAGDPTIATEWSECASVNAPGDRRFIITSNDFTMNSGSTHEIVMALITTPQSTSNTCPGAGFAEISTIADSAWNAFYNPFSLSVNNSPAANTGIRVYPNPAHNMLNIDYAAGTTKPEVAIHNVLGQRMAISVNETANGCTADISRLPQGVYNVICKTGTTQTTATFVKQ